MFNLPSLCFSIEGRISVLQLLELMSADFYTLYLSYMAVALTHFSKQVDYLNP